jgi:hypothetical protein
MQRCRGQLEQVQQRGDAARSGDRIDENEGAAGVGRQQVVQMLITLLLAAAQAGLLYLQITSRLSALVPCRFPLLPPPSCSGKTDLLRLRISLI